METEKKDNTQEPIKKAPIKVSGLTSETVPKKGPLSFLSGFLTSLLLAWMCLGLSVRLVSYFSLHSQHYSSPIAQSVASGFKTLVIGMSFLATFSFTFIGLGLAILFIRSLFTGKIQDAD